MSPIPDVPAAPRGNETIKFGFTLAEEGSVKEDPTYTLGYVLDKLRNSIAETIDEGFPLDITTLDIHIRWGDPTDLGRNPEPTLRATAYINKES